VTIGVQVDHLDVGVGKFSTGIWLGLRLGVFTCVMWQVTLYDPI